MTLTHSLLAAAAVLTLTTGVARADHESYDGLAAGVLVFGVIELAPAALLVTDLVARPQSRRYGGWEVGIGATAGTINTYLAINLYVTPNCSDCKDLVPYFATFAAIDLAVVAHGVYLLARDEQVEQLTLGTARGSLTPTVVSDGRSAAPGMGLTGTF